MARPGRLTIAVGFGMIPIVAPDCCRSPPHELHPRPESGILPSAIVAVVPNAFFKRASSAGEARAEHV